MWLEAASSAATAARERSNVDVLTLIGDVFGGIAAVGGVVAAVYSVVTWQQGKSNQQIADARYLRDIEPRPRVARQLSDGAPQYIEVEVVNAGGAALLSLFLVQYQDEVYAGGGTLPSHGSSPLRLLYRLTRQGDGTAIPTPLLIAAKDVQGSWWDCMVGTPINDLQTWWAEQFRSFNLPALSLNESPDGISIRIGGGE